MIKMPKRPLRKQDGRFNNLCGYQNDSHSFQRRQWYLRNRSRFNENRRKSRARARNAREESRSSCSIDDLELEFLHETEPNPFPLYEFFHFTSLKPSVIHAMNDIDFTKVFHDEF